MAVISARNSDDHRLINDKQKFCTCNLWLHRTHNIPSLLQNDVLVEEVKMLKNMVAELQAQVSAAEKREQARRSEQLAAAPAIKPSPEPRKSSIFDSLFKVTCLIPSSPFSVSPDSYPIIINWGHFIKNKFILCILLFDIIILLILCSTISCIIMFSCFLFEF